MVKPIFINKKKEKESEKESEKDKDFLGKKRTGSNAPKKDADMLKIKKKMKEMMFSIYDEVNNKTNDQDILYQQMSKNYLLNEFTSNCLNYINKIIINVLKNQLKKFQGIFELNKLFISIIKELLMNEFEIILLSLYLESVNISSCQDLISFQESIIFLCFFIKKITLKQDKLAPINSFLIRKYQDFEDNFNKWFNSNRNIFDTKLYFSYAEINQRFKEFNNTYSIYCKNNYIDYNLVIDRILTMSIPYNETKNEHNSGNKKNNSNNEMNKDSLNNNNNILKNNNINNNNMLQNNNINNININQNNLNNNLINNNHNNLNSFNTFLPITFPQFPSNLGNNLIIALNSLKDGNNTQNNIYKDLINSLRFFEAQKNNNSTNNTDILINNNFINIPNNQLKSNIMQNYNITTKIKKDNNEINNTNIKENQNNKNNLEKNETKQFNDNNLLNLGEEHKNRNQNSINNNLNILLSNGGINNNFLPTNYSTNLLNDYNQMKFNSNLGMNDINTMSQNSFLNLKNPSFNDINNLPNNAYHRQVTEDNLNNLMNYSGYLKSCYNINGINSSKNFFPNMQNNNFASNNIQDNMSNNNEIDINQINNKNFFNPSLIQNMNNQSLIKINSLNLEKNNINTNKVQKEK